MGVPLDRHLNPLRAGLVKDLKELDKYPWAGHSAIIGKCDNPLMPKSEGQALSVDKEIVFSKFHLESEKEEIDPENPVNPVKHDVVSLAEKTIEDVLLYFGEETEKARKKYRQFVRDGIERGSRPELQGGGLIRSSGGGKAWLLGRSSEERELADDRILGSGDFVAGALKKAREPFEEKSAVRPSLEELMVTVSQAFNITPNELRSSSRKRLNVQARSVFAHIAVRNHGYRGIEISDTLSSSPPTISRIVEKGQNVLDTNKDLAIKLSIVEI